MDGVAGAGAVPAYLHTPQKAFAMTHASEISAARRHSQLLAERAGLGATDAGRLAIVVTEAGTNILKHAGDGWLVLNALERNGAHAVEVLAFDRGPGITDLAGSLRDGVSTTGTAGTGLGAMQRLCDEFDVYSAPGRGTAVYMVVFAPPAVTDATAGAAQARFAVGAICLPVAGEDVCGDAWGIEEDHAGASVVVADGLGHGPGAAVASGAAIAALRHNPAAPAPHLLQAMHEALRPTRGAAAAVARLHCQRDEVAFVGIGNITACVIDSEQACGARSRQLVSHNGIVGHNLRKVQEFHTGWRAGSLFILCSDGIGTQWDLDAYPGLSACHPALVAAVLYRDFMRLRDDATVLVIRRLH